MIKWEHCTKIYSFHHYGTGFANLGWET